MSQWNELFTQLIRKSDPRLWGNWSLSQEVKLGAIGQLAADGTFAAVDALQGIQSERQATSRTWRMSTRNVRRSQASVQASGEVGGVPVGGATLDAGGAIKVEWEFASSNELSSEFNVSARERISNISAAIAANKERLNSIADGLSMRTAGSIDQGFGFVSAVVWSRSGANIAALTSGSKFGISGQAKAVANMLGSAGGGGEIAAQYSSVTESGTFDTQLWPAAPNDAPDSEVPLAFLFSSFDGTTHLPAWTGFVSSISVIFRNTGSYIATVIVRYNDAEGATEESYGGISGGLTRQIILPLDATDVQFEVRGVATGDRPTWLVPSPLTQAKDGLLRYRIGGLWPSGLTVTPED